MKSIMAGPDGSAIPGQIVELETVVAIDLVSKGYASFVDRGPLATLGIIAPPENTDARPVKAKQRGKK